MNKLIFFMIFILLCTPIFALDYQIDEEFNHEEILAIYNDLDVLIVPSINKDIINITQNTIIINFKDSKIDIYQSTDYLSESQINTFKTYFKENQNTNNIYPLMTKIVNSVALTIKNELKDDVIIIGETKKEESLKIESSDNYEINISYYFLIFYVVLIFFLIIFLIKREKELKPVDEESENIKNYLLDNMNKGYDLTSLKLTLIKHGYDQKKVEKVSKHL